VTKHLQSRNDKSVGLSQTLIIKKYSVEKYREHAEHVLSEGKTKKMAGFMEHLKSYKAHKPWRQK
jgi:hypothetical protein